MKKFLVFCLLLILFNSCSEKGIDSRQDYEEELRDRFQKIENLIAQGKCENPEDCDSMPLGNKPCGGPSSYVIFSESIDRDKLGAMVEQYTELEKEYNEKFGISSDCSLVGPPENIGCVNSECARIMNE